MNHSALLATAIVGMTVGIPTAAAETVPPPAATVGAHSVTQAAEHVTVRVPRTATYVGGDRFDLYRVADAEVQVFAEADANKHLKKLYWIQFERYWPSKPDLTHDYTKDRPMALWGTTTWLRSGPAAADAATRPGSDREHVAAILKRAGYIIPAEVMNVRMVQLLDDPRGSGRGRDELMLIYSEDLAPTGKTLAQLRNGDKLGAEWTPIGEELVERATKAFSVERK